MPQTTHPTEVFYTPSLPPYSCTYHYLPPPIVTTPSIPGLFATRRVFGLSCTSPLQTPFYLIFLGITSTLFYQTTHRLPLDLSHGHSRDSMLDIVTVIAFVLIIMHASRVSKLRDGIEGNGDCYYHFS